MRVFVDARDFRYVLIGTGMTLLGSIKYSLGILFFQFLKIISYNNFALIGIC